MKKHTSYIILSIITILCLFITAATCSFCGMQLDTASFDEESEKEYKENESSDTEEDKETAAEESAEQIEEEETSEESDVQISDETAEESVVVEDDEESVEEASAETEDTIGVIGEAMMLQTDRLSIIGSRSGYLSNGGDVSGVIYTGDDEEGHYYTAYLCFDISNLRGADITSAQLEIANIRQFGHLLDWGNPHFLFFDTYYGDTLEMDDFRNPHGVRLETSFISAMSSSVTLTSDNLASTIKEAVDAGRNWYQIMVGLTGDVGTTNGDDEKDGCRFMLEGLVLQVNYFGE